VEFVLIVLCRAIVGISLHSTNISHSSHVVPIKWNQGQQMCCHNDGNPLMVQKQLFNGFIRQKTMDTKFVKNHQSLHDCSEIFVQKLIAAMVVV
jgi:hypothetical protein